MMMKKVLIIVGIVLVVGLIGFFIFSKSSSKAVEVEKVPVENVEVAKTVSASGEVKANTEYDLAFENGGRINNLYAKKGDTVVKGKLLADAISTSDFNDIQALRDSRDIAMREKDIYVQTYQNNVEAVGGSKEYDANIRKLDEVISRANASLSSAVNGLAKQRILSPTDVTIVDVLKEANEVAALGQTVLRVADLNDLVFKVNVDQEDFGFLKTDQPVIITLDSYKDKTFSGKISSLPLFANSNGDFEVDIKLEPAKDAKILLGMTGDSEIKIESTNNKVPALSFDAISEDDKGKYVWIDDNGFLKKKYIETGLEGDFYTQVTTDLSGVTVVIPTEDVELTEGQAVKYAKSN